VPPASGEPAQAPDAAAAAAAAAAGQKATDDKTTDDEPSAPEQSLAPGAAAGEAPAAAPPGESAPGVVEAQPGPTTDKTTEDDEQRKTDDDSALNPAAAAETNKIEELCENFYTSMLKVQCEDYLYSLCDVWKVDRNPLEDMDDDTFEADRAGAYRALINDWLTRKIKQNWPRYPAHIGLILATNEFPRSLDDFYKQEETCRECAKVRAKWDRPGRRMSTYFCKGHMLGAFTVGAEFTLYPL
jgi:hypothetical protein